MAASYSVVHACPSVSLPHTLTTLLLSLTSSIHPIVQQVGELGLFSTNFPKKVVFLQYTEHIVSTLESQLSQIVVLYLQKFSSNIAPECGYFPREYPRCVVHFSVFSSLMTFESIPMCHSSGCCLQIL